MRLFWIGLLSIGIMQSAQADISNDTIRAYNAALTDGTDETVMAEKARTLAAEALANPQDETSVLLAYEAGATLCRLQHCADATAAANYVNAQTVSDPTAHPIPQDRALLAALANWEADKTRKTRRALDRVLDTLIETDPSQLSLQAFEARYTDDLQQGRTGRAAISAGDTGDHLRPIATLVPQRYALAELLAATSTFNSDQSPEAHRRITHLQGWLSQQRRLGGEDVPEWIHREENRAHAWGLAMNAWFISSNRKGIPAEERETILDSYLVEDDTIPTQPSETDTSEPSEADLPFCSGSLKQDPKLEYTGRQARRGFFGAVIVGFDIVDGSVTNPEIRASVPEQRFEETALEAVSQWSWVADETANPGVDCVMSRENIVQPIVFALD